MLTISGSANRNQVLNPEHPVEGQQTFLGRILNQSRRVSTRRVQCKGSVSSSYMLRSAFTGHVVALLPYTVCGCNLRGGACVRERSTLSVAQLNPAHFRLGVHVRRQVLNCIRYIDILFFPVWAITGIWVEYIAKQCQGSLQILRRDSRRPWQRSHALLCRSPLFGPTQSMIHGRPPQNFMNPIQKSQ